MSIVCNFVSPSRLSNRAHDVKHQALLRGYVGPSLAAAVVALAAISSADASVVARYVYTGPDYTSFGGTVLPSDHVTATFDFLTPIFAGTVVPRETPVDFTIGSGRFLVSGRTSAGEPSPLSYFAVDDTGDVLSWAFSVVTSPPGNGERFNISSTHDGVTSRDQIFVFTRLPFVLTGTGSASNEAGRWVVTYREVQIPEPATIWMVVLAVVAATAGRRRKRVFRG